MKICLIFLCFTLLTFLGNLSALSQVYNLQVMDAVEKVSLTDIYFVNQNTGYAVGDSGIILHTTDGGSNWNRYQYADDLILHSIYFSCPSRGWISGEKGLLLHTADAGKNWTPQTVSTSSTLYKVFFADSLTGFAVGSHTLLSTSDGGTTWTENHSYPDWDFYDVQFINPDEGWVVGGSTLLHTVDGGINWSLNNLDTRACLYGVSFIDARNGYLVGDDATVLRTEDGGEYWRKVYGNRPIWLNHVHFCSKDKGCCAGMTDGEYAATGVFLWTEDSGLSWQEINCNSCLHSACFSKPGVAWLAGANGFVAQLNLLMR